jgi:(p)ppGpp synthase/HD superfamily hydrolase
MEILYAWRGVPDFDVDLALSVAWLHDILEDTEVSAEALRQGFGDRVLICVRALTKDETVPMEERIADVLRRLPGVPREAGLVKMADRITNLQPPPSFWTAEKCREYCREAEQIFTALRSQHPVLRERLSRKIEDYRQFCGEN